jgi:pimeloyl-ACP methyl ester carboxylesterase
MATFALIPGAGGAAWYWHRVVPLLKAAGHGAIPVDLPGEDARVGFVGYARQVVRAIGRRRDVVLVAQSLGGFTAPLVCERASVQALIFVNAMIPVPGERAGDWWKATGSAKAMVAAARRGGYSTTFDDETYFLHDVPRAVVQEGARHKRDQSERIFASPCRFKRWPEVPIHVIVGRDDRLFPLEFQRRVARERLGRDVDVLRGGHLVALSNPRGLAARLIAVANQLRR